MKTSKLFTIDVDIAERLKNINGSELANRLLKEYFELRSDKNTLKDEKKAVLSLIIKKKNNFLKKLRLLMSGIRLAWIIMRGLGLKQGWNFLRELISILIYKEEESISLQQLYLKHSSYLETMETY